MARIAMVAGGTRGDVQPYVALGRGLRAAGHDVGLLTTDGFEALATEAGLGFVSTGENIEELLRSEEWREKLASGNMLTIRARMGAEMRRRAVGIGPLLRDRLAASDLLVAGLAGLGGAFTVASSLGLPIVQAYVTPFTPTREYASPLAPAIPLGGALNRASFGVMQQLLWQMSSTGDVVARRELGLPKGSPFGPFRALAQRGEPVLHGYSARVLPRPADWPANTRVTGYWFLDTADDWTPSPDLTAFLDAGDPPVYIGFGSMIGGNPEEAGRIALAALAQSGRRGVLATGWGGLAPTDLPANIHLIGAVPHDWLFPRMAAIVHHGGVGTTAAALRAGVPSVVMPFSVDQPYWGRRVAALGVGTDPIPRKQLTAERLGAAITRCVIDDGMRRRAADLGQAIRAENGVRTAVTAINEAIRDARVGEADAAGLPEQR